jgi:hypothetical protein
MIQGQIQKTTERGLIITNIIKEYKPKNIVEIGTWKGLGSTLCVIESIDYSVNFISIESNYEFYNIAKENLKDYSKIVNLEYGRIIEISEIESFLKEVELDSIQQQWLSDDINNFNKCNNIFNKLPENIDLLILDGGEFSSYKEWEKLKIKTNIVILDDINVLKNKKVFHELSNDTTFQMLNITDEGNGLATFKRK